MSMLSMKLVVNGSKISTKNFVKLNADICQGDKIGLTGGQSSTHFLYNLPELGLQTHAQYFRMGVLL